MDSRKVVQENRDYTMFSWSVQGAWNPIHMKRGQGVWFWDGDDNRWLDLSSQLINLNLGHQHPKMPEAISFPGHGPVRTLYLSILASHVILSIVALPMVLTTFFFSLAGRFARHRRIARWTFPIWLYVSITGGGFRVPQGGCVLDSVLVQPDLRE